MDFHSLVFSGLYLFLTGWHLLPRPTIDDKCFLCAEAECCSGGIDGYVSTANYGYSLPYLHILHSVDITEEGDTMIDALHILTGNIQFHASVSTDSNENRLITLLAEASQSQAIFAHRAIQLYVNTEFSNRLDVSL